MVMCTYTIETLWDFHLNKSGPLFRKSSEEKNPFFLKERSDLTKFIWEYERDIWLSDHVKAILYDPPEIFLADGEETVRDYKCIWKQGDFICIQNSQFIV